MQTNSPPQQFDYPLRSTKTVIAYKLNRSLVAMTYYLPRCAFDPRWSLWPSVVDTTANRWNEIKTGFTQDIDLLAKEIRANTDALLHSPGALRSYYKFLDTLLLKPVKQFCEIDFWKDTVYKGPYKCEQARINSCPLYPFQELISEIRDLLLMEDRTDLFDSWGNVEFGDIVEDEAALRPALIKFNRLCSGLMWEVKGVAAVINSHFELAFPDIAEQESELVFTPVSAKSGSKKPAAPPIANVTDKTDLRAREKILIHCYEEGPVIRRGQPGYDNYRRYQTAKKRIAYPNDSIHRAKPLIESIKKILPFLSAKAAQQANSELDTLMTQFEL